MTMNNLQQCHNKRSNKSEAATDVSLRLSPLNHLGFARLRVDQGCLSSAVLPFCDSQKSSNVFTDPSESVTEGRTGFKTLATD